MVDKNIRIPEFVINISSSLLMETDKSGSVLFINEKAKCVFGGIAVNANLKSCVTDEDWSVLNKNIEIALYNQYAHYFYWEYKGRFYIVHIYPKDFSVWLWFDDVTEKRHLSHLLNVNALRSSLNENYSKSGYWELDIANKRFYWSSGVYKLFDIDEIDDGLFCRKNLIRELILPQDIDLYKNELKKLLKYKMLNLY